MPPRLAGRCWENGGAAELARRLGDGVHNVLMAAVALGYEDLDAETGE